MKISLEADYAIRIILYIFQKNKIVPGIEIIKNCEIPERMGFRILTKLSTNNLLKSIKGKGGGFLFPEENINISLFDIINLFDNFKLNRCLSSAKNCSYKNGNCVICESLKKINNNIIENFSQILIKDLWKKQNY